MYEQQQHPRLQDCDHAVSPRSRLQEDRKSPARQAHEEEKVDSSIRWPGQEEERPLKDTGSAWDADYQTSSCKVGGQLRTSFRTIFSVVFAKYRVEPQSIEIFRSVQLEFEAWKQRPGLQ